MAEFKVDMDALSIDQIASAMVTAMHRKGITDTAAHLLSVFNHPHGGSAEVLKEASRMLVRGSDDEWSGRTNDIKRAYHDGVRKVAGNVVEEALMYGEAVTEKTLNRF